MIIRIVTFIIYAVAFTLAAFAENYTVYSVHGKVWERTDRGNVPIAPKASHLTGDSHIVIGNGGSLTLYLGESRQLVTVTEKGVQRLATLIRRADPSRRSAAKWVGSLVGSLVKSDTPEQTHRRVLQSQGGSHRGEDEDMALANAFARYVADGVSYADGKVTYEIIDSEDGTSYVEVTNLTDEYLFVNLVVADAEGRSLLLPVDVNPDNSCCAHLCVAPQSTVSFTELAFFRDWNDDAVLVLVASPVEVNFTVLCNRSTVYRPAQQTLPIHISTH